MLIAAFSDTITLGAVIISALSAAAVIVGVFYGAKYKVSYQAASAAAEELRKSLSDEKGRAREEKDEAAEVIGQLRTALAASQKTVARLEGLPDMAQLVTLLDRHEVRAQERHEMTAGVLQALTDRLTST